jgi:protein-tyrosine phosphatase
MTASYKAVMLRCASPGKGSTYKQYASPLLGSRAQASRLLYEAVELVFTRVALLRCSKNRLEKRLFTTSTCMIDLHCHILPATDDGPEDLEEAVEMCRIAFADGIRTIAATPHCLDGVHENDEKSIICALFRLQERLTQNRIPLTLVPGADIHMHHGIVPFLRENPRLCIGGRYVLLELPSHTVPASTGELIFNLHTAGYLPVITHPERNYILQNSLEGVRGLIRAGAFIQVTAMSITGENGEEARKAVLRMLRDKMVHVVATDAHSANWRRPVLSEAGKVLKELAGADLAGKLLSTNPRMMLKGIVLSGSAPEEKKQRGRAALLRRVFKLQEGSPDYRRAL